MNAALTRVIIALKRLWAWLDHFKFRESYEESWKREMMLAGARELEEREREVRETLEEEQRQHEATEAQKVKDLEQLRLIFREELKAAFDGISLPIRAE